jgi:hypothetical protein
MEIQKCHSLLESEKGYTIRKIRKDKWKYRYKIKGKRSSDLVYRSISSTAYSTF